jgi:hypothetical protein
MRKSNQKDPGEIHAASLAPVRQPPIVVPPAALSRGKKRSPATLRVAQRHRPQLIKLPRYPGPTFVVRCKICGKETRIARSDVTPLCEDCVLNVVPAAIVHAIVVNDAVGASEFDLEMVMGQLEFDYLNEVSRRQPGRLGRGTGSENNNHFGSCRLASLR